MGRETEQILRGSIERVTFRNPENGYAVIKLKISNRNEIVTVTGNLLEAKVGSHVVARGRYEEHPKYGRQLFASSITSTPPSDSAGIERYLGSGLIKGIGEKTAQKLVEEFGEQTIETILNDPQKVAGVSGVGSHKAALLREAFSAEAENQEALRFLVEHNITPGLAAKIIEKYKARTIELVKKDPYQLSRQLRGIGFKTADAIAMNLGLASDSCQRIKAGLCHALEKSLDEGHCYLDKDLLMQRASSLLQLEVDEGFEKQLNELLKEGYLVCLEGRVAFSYISKAEQFVADFCYQRLRHNKNDLFDSKELLQGLRSLEEELGIHFSSEQRAAVDYSLRYPLLLITGGPGSGKTTITRAITALHKKLGKRIALCAPTGRAAQRMSQICNMPASTVHRLLGYDPVKKGFLHDSSNQLNQYDLVIVDEASMLDVLLTRDLLCAIPSSSAVIFVGDKDQLPSVGPGRVFADMLALSNLKTVFLSQLFRRQDDSSINEIAHQVNAGIMPDFSNAGDENPLSKDAFFISKKNAEDAAESIELLISQRIPQRFNFDIKHTLILTPANRGPLGTEILNKRLQQRLNPSRDKEQEIKLKDTTFRLGDKVCQRVNNYKLDESGVFNGDTGIIENVDKKNEEIVVQLWDGRRITYRRSDMHQLSLAYAMTVHRSQGSESPCVILALHDSHFTLLERQLIYTAVTRAKELLVVVGSRRAFSIACKRTNASRRLTSLNERIESFLQSKSAL